MRGSSIRRVAYLTIGKSSKGRAGDSWKRSKKKVKYIACFNLIKTLLTLQSLMYTLVHNSLLGFAKRFVPCLKVIAYINIITAAVMF